MPRDVRRVTSRTAGDIVAEFPGYVGEQITNAFTPALWAFRPRGFADEKGQQQYAADE
jgi:hypothetical protein